MGVKRQIQVVATMGLQPGNQPCRCTLSTQLNSRCQHSRQCAQACFNFAKLDALPSQFDLAVLAAEIHQLVRRISEPSIASEVQTFSRHAWERVGNE